MKTTPNPSATKNRRGELVAPDPPEFPLLLVVVAAALAAVVVDGDILEVEKVGVGGLWEIAGMQMQIKC